MACCVCRSQYWTLTCWQDLQDHHQISDIVSRCHGTLLVRAHLTHLFNLLSTDTNHMMSKSFKQRQIEMCQTEICRCKQKNVCSRGHVMSSQCDITVWKCWVRTTSMFTIVSIFYWRPRLLLLYNKIQNKSGPLKVAVKGETKGSAGFSSEPAT